MGIFDLRKNLFQGVKASGVAAATQRVAPFIVAATLGYTAADLTTMAVRPDMLPSEAPPVRPRTPHGKKGPSLSEYAVIRERNIFNSDGKIPPALSQDQGEDTGPENDQAVASKLPLALQGTIVHFNPDKSIATIRLNNKNITQSFLPGEEIDNMAEVISVERRRVIFRNLNNRRKEYIEIPEGAAFDFSMQAKGPQKSSEPVAQTGRFNYAVKRTEVEKLTSNLSEVLQQARMEPRFGPDNAVNGFCFVSIQSSSIYETLGFQVGDCISSVNGEEVNSPQKAMEFYRGLKNANNIQLGVDRDGRNETFNYNIN